MTKFRILKKKIYDLGGGFKTPSYFEIEFATEPHERNQEGLYHFENLLAEKSHDSQTGSTPLHWLRLFLSKILEECAEAFGSLCDKEKLEITINDHTYNPKATIGIINNTQTLTIYLPKIVKIEKKISLALYIS